MLVLLDSETPSRLSYSREGPGRQCLEVAPRAESRKGQLFACCLPCVPAQSPKGLPHGSLLLQSTGRETGPYSGHTSKQGQGPGMARANSNQSPEVLHLSPDAYWNLPSLCPAQILGSCASAWRQPRAPPSFY